MKVQSLLWTLALCLVLAVCNSDATNETRSESSIVNRVRRKKTKCKVIDSHYVSSSPPPSRPISRIRLALTGDDRSMRVSWSSPAPCKNPKVWIRKIEAKSKKTKFTGVIEQPYVFRYRRYVYRSQYFHHALITGLDHKARYMYRIKCGSKKSTKLPFTSPPQLGSRSPVRLFAFGDHGTDREARRTLDAMVNVTRFKDYDMVIHLGDISYANGEDTEYEWDVWGDMVQPLTSQIPYMVTPGNHEIDEDDSGGELGIAYRKRFYMPMTFRGSRSEYWYSWDYGQIHFVSVSTSHSDNRIQQQWIANDLRNAARRRHITPWIIVVGHDPPYSHNTYHYSHGDLRDWLDPLLVTYKVDLGLWGHNHGYERTYPIADSDVVQRNYQNAQAPVHVICGAAGKDLYDCWKDNSRYSAFQEGRTWGYCTVEVTSASMAKIQFVNSFNGRIVDTFTLTKRRN